MHSCVALRSALSCRWSKISTLEEKWSKVKAILELIQLAGMVHIDMLIAKAVYCTQILFNAETA